MREDGLLGWATDALVKLDDILPGVLARLLTAGPQRRQAIFAALALKNDHHTDVSVNASSQCPSLADVIRHGRAKDILGHACGDVPSGFLTLLERIGERPLPRAKDYITIWQLLISDDMRGANALRECGPITPRKLEVVAALDPRWRHTHVLQRLETGAQAKTFNSAVSFIQSINTKATDNAIGDAIASMRPTSSLPSLLDRLLRRADLLPAHPIGHGHCEVRPFTTIREYLVAARKYQNCLAHRISDVAAGRMAIAEFRDEVLLEFRPLSLNAGWVVVGTHGFRNAPVPLDLNYAATVACQKLGVPGIDEWRGDALWRSYCRFTRELEWS